MNTAAPYAFAPASLFRSWVPQIVALVLGAFEAKVSTSAREGLTLERAFLGDDAGVIGAALLD